MLISCKNQTINYNLQKKISLFIMKALIYIVLFVYLAKN